jgi:nuclear transport factor 2 (NTF2) superfamily protein
MSTNSSAIEIKPPCPPFTYEDAVKKVRMAEDAWNSRNPDKVRKDKHTNNCKRPNRQGMYCIQTSN